MKKTLLTLLATAAGALFPGAINAEEKKPRFNLWVESFASIDTSGHNLWVPRIEVYDGKNKYFFRGDYKKTHDAEAYRIGSRLPLDFDALRGEIGAFCTTDSDDNQGIGVEFDGDLLDFFKVSGSLEKTNGHQLKHIMLGKDFPLDITAKLGYFNLDGTSHLNGAAWKKFDDQYVLALGGRVNEDGKGYINACFGRYAQKTGEGIGWRLSGQTDFDGNWNLDGILTIGNKFSAASFTGLMDAYKGGINDPGIVSNIVDFRPAPKYQKGQHAEIRFSVNKQKGQPAQYFAEAHYNFGNLGPIENIRAGGRWNHTDISNPQDIFAAVLSAKIGPVLVEFIGKLQDGSTPSYTVWAGTSLNECIDCFRGDE